MRMLAGLIILISSALTGVDAPLAAGLPPLAEVTPLGGVTIFFDPDKISAVYQSPLIADTKGTRRTVPKTTKPPIKTFVLGLRELPSPIEADPKAFLDRFNISGQFVHLHTLNGDLYLKATVVAWITRATGDVLDKRVGAFVYPGLSAVGGRKVPWQVFETPDEVAKLVDDIRAGQGDQ